MSIPRRPFNPMAIARGRQSLTARNLIDPLGLIPNPFGGGIDYHKQTYTDPDTGERRTIRVRGNPNKQSPIPGYNRPSAGGRPSWLSRTRVRVASGGNAFANNPLPSGWTRNASGTIVRS